MPIKYAIWKVGQKPAPLTSSALASEHLLEDMIVGAVTRGSLRRPWVARVRRSAYLQAMRFSRHAVIAALIAVNAMHGCRSIREAARSNAVAPVPPLSANAAADRYFKDRSLDSIEGIWIWHDGLYEVAIVQDGSKVQGYDYMAIVIDAQQGTWKPGEIKFALRKTATQGAFACLYWGSDGTEYRTTLLQTNPNLLSFSLPLGWRGAPETSLLIRTFPAEQQPETAEASGSGTAFWIDSTTLATNEHVVRNSSDIRIVVNGDEVPADLLVSDARNDLALLRPERPIAGVLPARVGRKELLVLGERVFVMGFPLSTILGSSPTVSEGIVSKLTGVEDDPREFQISAPIQSGSSGSPVFDASGNLVGVLSSTLSADPVVRSGGSLPQNVNFAVRVVYLRSLIETAGVVPAETPVSSIQSSADLAREMAGVVVRVKAAR